MGRNVIALKALYVALGGDADDVASISTIDEMIDAIATLIPTALAGVLPDASKATAGQVLTVVDGEWKAANLPQ